MSPYHYTHNNPINRFDPDGRDDAHFFTTKQKEGLWNNWSATDKSFEHNFVNDVGPTALDVLSVGFLLAGPGGAPASFATSSLSVVWQAARENHTTDALVSGGTDILGVVSKPKVAIGVALLQVIYDFTLAGPDHEIKNSTNMSSADNTNVILNVEDVNNVNVDDVDDETRKALEWIRREREAMNSKSYYEEHRVTTGTE